MKDKSKVWMICFIISVIIIIGLVIWILNISLDKKIADNSSASSTGSSTSQRGTTDSDGLDDMRRIRINEDFSKEGTVENLKNVRWSNANIMQSDNEMDIDIMLNNESEKEKVKATTLTVKLLDKQGKVIKSKDVKMEEIPAKFGYTTLNLKFDITDLMIIYDIQIVAK